MKKYLTFLTCIFIWSSAHACYAPPEEFVVSPEALVGRSKNIYYAEAVSKDQSGNYEFKVIEDFNVKQVGLVSKILIFLGLKKPPNVTEVSNFKISASQAPYKGGDFNKHQDNDFWSSSGGRVDIAPDCELKLTFEVGKKYLVFIDKPYHFKSFEEVSSTDDKWYLKIKGLKAGR